MSFFSFSPKVESVGSFYLVSGVPVKALEYDLRNNFGTSVIFTRLVTKVSSRSFKIHRFFMVELAWILDHLTSQRNPRTVARYAVGMLKYKQLFDEIKTKTWISSTFETWPSYNLEPMLKLFNFKPYPDQREFLEEYSRIKNGYQLRGTLLDAEVGSGKSITSLMWAEMISPGKIVVICPRGLVTSPWKLEIEKVYKNPPKYWSTLDGTNVLDHLDSKIFIIHIEQIRTSNWINVINAISKNGKEPIKVIVDECHNFNEPKSQQTQGLIEFCTHPGVSDVLEMSGTPIKAQGRETYALFCIIDKFFDVNVRDSFLKMYGRDNSYLNEMLAHRLGRIKFTINTISGMEAPPEPEIINVSFPGCEKFTLDNIRIEMMKYITDRIYFYRKMLPEYTKDWQAFVDQYRELVASDQGDIADLNRYLEIVKYFQVNGYNNFTDAHLSKFANKVEKRIEEQLRGEELKYFRHIKSAIKYVGLKIRGEALGNVLGKARMEAVRETIRHAGLPELINSVKKKTLVYTSYVDVIDELIIYFKEEGINASYVHGDNSKEIDTVVEKFATDPDINPLCTTFSTLREGKPMLMANQIILMNSPFRSYELKQTIARIHRRGQDEECFVRMINLDTGEKENITSRSIDIMEWSKAAVEQLLGGGKLPGANDLGQNLKAIGGLERYENSDITNFDDYFENMFQGVLDSVPETESRVQPKVKTKRTILDIF